MSDSLLDDPFLSDAPADPVDEAVEAPSSAPEARTSKSDKGDKPARRSGSRRSSSTRRSAKPTDAAEAIALYIRYSRLTDSERASLAGLLGTESDAETLAAAVASGASADTSAFEALEELAGAEADEAAVRAHVLFENRKAFNRVWSLVDSLADHEVPRSSVDAALALSRAVATMDDAERAAITSPLELLKR